MSEQTLTNNSQSTLRTRLIRARTMRKKSQAALAKEAGIKQQAIQRIEAGKVSQTRAILLLAMALQVCPYWLAFGLGGDEPVWKDIPKINEVITE